MEHRDEPNATQLFRELVQIRDRASGSVGVVVKCCSEFSYQSSQDKLHGELFANISAIYQSAHSCFKSTMTSFMHFFLKVNVCCLAVMITRTHQLFTSSWCDCQLSQLAVFCNVGGETCWNFVSSNMAPLCLDTSPHSGGQLTSAADSQAVISNFIHEVAKAVADISKNEVAMVLLMLNSLR